MLQCLVSIRKYLATHIPTVLASKCRAKGGERELPWHLNICFFVVTNPRDESLWMPISPESPFQGLALRSPSILHFGIRYTLLHQCSLDSLRIL
jgi:hypothetical protein